MLIYLKTNTIKKFSFLNKRVSTWYFLSFVFQGYNKGGCIKHNLSYPIVFFPTINLKYSHRNSSMQFHLVFFWGGGLQRLCLLPMGSGVASVTCWFSLPPSLLQLTWGSVSWRGLHSPQSCEGFFREASGSCSETCHQAHPGAPSSLETKTPAFLARPVPQRSKHTLWAAGVERRRLAPFSATLHFWVKIMH